MITIHKYPFEIVSEFTLELPYLPTFLSCQLQDDRAIMWFLVDDDNPKILFKFRIFGTGHKIPEGLRLTHQGTLQMPDGFVWHIFHDYTDPPKKNLGLIMSLPLQIKF